jgi:alpha/beta superfamily hydrolase
MADGVVASCEALRAGGFAALRFNFGGVGRSQGFFGGFEAQVGAACAPACAGSS